MLDEQELLWKYLSPGQQALVRQGFYLLEDAKTHTPVHPITDYSYLVFPFAKAYEGFLKQLFLDLRFIRRWEYESDHFRIGKVLSPHLARQLRKTSVYTQIVVMLQNSDLADTLWLVWKHCRNVVFHYFPHNLQAVDMVRAEMMIQEITDVMEQAIEVTNVLRRGDSQNRGLH